MSFDWEAPIPGWDKSQKPYAKAIQELQKNKVLKKLASEYAVKKLFVQMRAMLRARDLDYLDPIVCALQKLITHDHHKHRIMEQIIENVRWHVEKNVRKKLEIEW